MAGVICNQKCSISASENKVRVKERLDRWFPNSWTKSLLLTSAKLNKSIWSQILFFLFILFNIKPYLLYWKFAKKTAFCLEMKSEFHMHT